MHTDAPTPEPGSLPTAPLGRLLRWQILLAFLGIAILSTLLGLTAYNISTVVVPERGGVFREGVAGYPQYINPLLCHVHEVDQDFCGLLYRGLTRLDKHGQVVPDLAEAWTVTPDGLVYTFRLRPNLYWHDGTPVTVEDVLFTVEMLQAPDSPVVPDLAQFWRTVEVEAVDERTLRFTLERSFAPFLDYTTVGLLPKHIWQNVPPSQLATTPLNLNPVGTGPMQVVQIGADGIRLEPNPYYPGKLPYISALEFRFYPDYPSIFAAFTRGELDGISRILPTDLAVARERPDLQLFTTLEPKYVSVVFNLQNPDVAFFQEKAVRQALLYGLDREALVAEVLNGQGVVAHSPLPAQNWAYAEDVPRYGYDPEQARRLLDEAGWIDRDGDGIREKEGQALRFILLSNDDPIRDRAIQWLAERWRALGVDVRPQTVSFAGLVTDFLAPRRFDATLIAWDLAGDPDPYPLWHSSQAREGAQNYAGWENPQADALMEDARAEIDPQRRRELYIAFQRLFAEELPALPLYYPTYTYGVSRRVKNVQIGPINNRADRFATFPDWYIVTRRVPANQARTP